MSVLEKLRQYMAMEKVDGYVIPSSDPHQSEYVADCFKRREYVSGFTGSAGLALVTGDKALLWTDGRYYEQAERELSKDWVLMRASDKGVLTLGDYLCKNMRGTVIGYDPWTLSDSQVTAYRKKIGQKKSGDSPDEILRMRHVPHNLVDLVWEKDEKNPRPAFPAHPMTVHRMEFAGQRVSDKVAAVRKTGTAEAVGNTQWEACLVASLDEIAWLFNIRGADISFSPVTICYALIRQTGPCTLFVDGRKLASPEVANHLLECGVEFDDYGNVGAAIRGLVGTWEKEEDAAAERRKSKRLRIDTRMTPYGLVADINHRHLLKEASSPIIGLMERKNDTEIGGAKRSQIQDGIVMVAFLKYCSELGSSIRDQKPTTREHQPITEYSVAQEMDILRLSRPGCRGLSFETIVGADENGSVIHYRPLPETAKPLTPDAMLVVDSGSHYDYGTTDVTRTVHLGRPTAEQVRVHTLVLRAHIEMARTLVPTAASAVSLDLFARKEMWMAQLDYRHGTGHGVGSYLNVHEGNGFGNTALRAGMTITNEPGCYLPGKFGVRIESMVLTVPLPLMNADGTVREHKAADKKPKETAGAAAPAPVVFLGLETITLAPIQRDLVDPAMLTPAQLAWLNEYHRRVYAALADELEPEHRAWLQRQTAPLVV